MIELGIIYGIVSMICWGVSDYVCSLAAKKLNPLKMYFWFNLFGTIPLIIMTLFMTGFHIPSNQNMLTYVVVAFGYLFGNLALIKGLKVGKVSIVVPVSSMWPVLIVGFSLFFLGETLNLVNSVAVALIIFSLIIVSITKEKKHLKRKEVVRSLKYATLAALCWGIANSLYVSLARTDGWFWSALIAQVLVIILSFAIILIIKQDVKLSKRDPIRELSIIGIIGIIAFLAFGYGLNVLDAVIVAPVAASYPAVTVILAKVFLKERLHIIQDIGILGIIVGIILLSI